MKLCLWSFIFLLNATFVVAQRSTTLHGIVLSGNSKEVLPGASLTLYYGGAVSGLVANKEGNFSIATGVFYDSLRVSMVGYHSKIYYSNAIDIANNLEVRLDIAPAALQEVVVRSATAVDVLKRAIVKIPANQPTDNFENKGFYREIIKDRENYFSVLEAIFNLQYFPSKKTIK